MKRIRIPVFAAAFICAVLVSVGLIKIHKIPEIQQYVIDAPADYEDMLMLSERKDEALSDMKEAVKASCVTAYTPAADLTSSAGSAEAAIYAGSPGMFAVYPGYLLEGRLISETELQKGDSVIVLGKELAFRLFPVTDAVGNEVKLNGRQYTVVGIVRDTGSIVTDNEYTAYIPLKGAEDVRFETMLLSVLPVPGSGAGIRFRNTIPSAWIPEGSCYDLEKEGMRASLPIRIPVILACTAVIIKLIGMLLDLYRKWYDRLCRRFENVYITSLLAQIVLYILSAAAASLVCFFVIWKFAQWTVVPLKVFTEWVPDDPTSWNSIKTVLKQMAADAAEKKILFSAEVCVIRYWHTIIAYSVIGMLSFGIISLRRGKDC